MRAATSRRQSVMAAVLLGSTLPVVCTGCASSPGQKCRQSDARDFLQVEAWWFPPNEGYAAKEDTWVTVFGGWGDGYSMTGRLRPRKYYLKTDNHQPYTLGEAQRAELFALVDDIVLRDGTYRCGNDDLPPVFESGMFALYLRCGFRQYAFLFVNDFEQEANPLQRQMLLPALRLLYFASQMPGLEAKDEWRERLRAAIDRWTDDLRINGGIRCCPQTW